MTEFRKKKILFIASLDSHHSMRWVGHFEELGHNITVLNISKNRDADIPGCKVINVGYTPFKILDFIIGYFIARFQLRTNGYDVVHVHYLGYNLIPALAFEPGKLVLTAWGSDVLLSKGKWLRQILLKNALSHAAVVTGDSEEIIENIQKISSPRSRPHRINFGVETKRFVSMKRGHSVDTSNSLRIISLRNLERIYDIECLIRAIEKLKNEDFTVTCDIYGDGSHKDDLKSLVTSLGLGEKIQFKGRYDARELPQIFANYDVYVSTSTADAGIAASTAEAMSSELPVIISDSAENKVWIDDGRNGFLYKTSSAEELAGKLAAFMKITAEKISEIGRNGRQTIIDKNDIENEMGKMNRLLIELNA